jgi:energy-converting hydrogenase A subunit Q
MIDSFTKTPRPLRHVDVDYLVDQTKCAKCSDKPCLQSCPIDAVYMDDDDGLIKLKNTCFGCVLCRNACPYDAISLDVHMDPPKKENVPNINTKLCKACGACVQAVCQKQGAEVSSPWSFVDAGEAGPGERFRKRI